MPRKSKYSRRTKGGDIVKLIALLCILTMFIAGGIFVYINRTVAPDKITLCPSTGPRGQVVVLVDNTDPYNFIQRQAFTEALQSLTNDIVKEGYLFSVYALGEDFKQNAEPIFEKCNPGTSEGKSQLNANLKRIDERFNNDYFQPVMQLEKLLMLDQAAKYSPIFEMLQVASINAFRAKDITGPKILVIFSDMLPNTQEFSMFKGVPEFDKFKNTEYGQRTLTEFRGVSVMLNYLMTYPKLQTRKQLNFWEQYFEQAGARITKVRAMEG